jgi:hypothetical protein
MKPTSSYLGIHLELLCSLFPDLPSSSPYWRTGCVSIDHPILFISISSLDLGEVAPTLRARPSDAKNANTRLSHGLRARTMKVLRPLIRLALYLSLLSKALSLALPSRGCALLHYSHDSCLTYGNAVPKDWHLRLDTCIGPCRRSRVWSAPSLPV